MVGRCEPQMTDGILATVKGWTGEPPAAGCPWYAFHDPFVGRVLAAHSFFDKGQLATYAPSASHRLIEGVAFYHRVSEKAYASRLELEHERRASRPGVMRG